MKKDDIPFIAGRKGLLPRVYGDTPTFLGVPALKAKGELRRSDTVVLGVPWEGTITWGGYSGCELAPKAVRQVSARYGGYLPEYNINLFDYVRVFDAGDVVVHPGSPENTMKAVGEKAQEIYCAGAVPFCLGGDHSFTPEIVRSLCAHTKGKVGVIHFDAHFDNMPTYGTDKFPRCGPLYRIAQLEGVRRESIVHIGIRGPRNAPSQYEFAKKIGASVFGIDKIRKVGIASVVRSALKVACKGTEAVYVTICSDVVDVAYNPGGPADFDGLTSHELFYALHQLGKRGIQGLDFVEIYPLFDRNDVSAHLAAWAFIHALVGVAAGRRKAR